MNRTKTQPDGPTQVVTFRLPYYEFEYLNTIKDIMQLYGVKKFTEYLADTTVIHEEMLRKKNIHLSDVARLAVKNLIQNFIDPIELYKHHRSKLENLF